jgi:hypothetical protein
MNKSTMAQIHSKFYCEKVKMCWFSSVDWFFCTKFVQRAALAGTSKKECNKLDLTAASIFLIGLGGLLLVVPMYMQFQLQFYWWGRIKKQLNLDI